MEFLPCGKHPDYRSNMPGAAVSGRAIVPKPFDGRLLGEDFRRIRPPIPEFMVFGGMMVGKEDIPRLIGRFRSAANFIYSAKLFARYLTRSPQISARHPTHDGQCASRTAVLQSAKAKGADPVRGLDCRHSEGPPHRHRCAHRRWRKGDPGQGAKRRGARDRRLCAQQDIPRRLHAATRARAFAQP